MSPKNSDSKTKDSRFKWLFVLLFIALIATLIWALKTQPPKFSTAERAEPIQPGYYQVIEVHDGDTIDVDMNGNRETIRMVGVDTPETHHPDKPVQCYGPEASRYTTDQLSDQSVRLESDDQSTNRDRYDRLLRYVYTESGELYNQELITQGYGFAYTSFPFSKMDEFRLAEASARANNLGLWASCQPTLNEYGGYESNGF